MHSFTIVVDSSCDLPQEFIQEHDIEILPMPFELDGQPHHQGYWQEISEKEFYDALRSGSVSKTSTINQETFLRAFASFAEQGKDALFIILSSGLSATFQHAEIALEKTREAYPGCNLYLIDGINATSGHGLLALLAAKKRAEGLSAGETASWLEANKHYCLSLFTVDDLMYLHRGGRLSKLSAIAGSAIGIKPILNVAPDGTLKLKDKARSRKAAMKLLVSQVKQSIDPDTTLDLILVSHSDCLDDAKTLAEMFKNALSVTDVAIVMMGPVIGTHVGPGALAVFFAADMTRNEYEKKYYSGT